MNRVIRHQFLYAHPKETVWEYLTNAELLAQWLMRNDFQPVVGHEFQFRTKPIPALDFDGINYCKVLEVVPFQTLSYTWNTGPGDGRITMESVV
ncbi:MAG TPA: SRPBCC domain-containing protein, partial [Chitinophagaceae bacterium]|nr:SRPBCC domain-containing protein [Chitinophagaceae bacterium]